MSTIHQFRNDYSEGAAPEMLEALVRTNGEQTPGYGTDARCEKAVVLIRRAIQQPDAFVQFIPGGTAANIVAISALTDEFEGPILAADAHPTAHETGAIEGCGRRWPTGAVDLAKPWRLSARYRVRQRPFRRRIMTANHRPIGGSR